MTSGDTLFCAGRRPCAGRRLGVVPAAFLILALIWALSAGGCRNPDSQKAQTSQAISLVRLDQGEYPDFSDSRGFKGLDVALARNLAYLSRIPGSRSFVYGRDRFTGAHLIRSIKVFQEFLARHPDGARVNAFIRRRFQVYRSQGDDQGQVLFTGYYEPSYPGRLMPDKVFCYPVYSRPKDLVQIDLSLFSDRYKGHKRLMARVDEQTRQVVPYYTREEINQDPDFADRACPLVWLKSRVDRFFLEIQGSGRVVLDTGDVLRLHYAGSNGKAYRSVGRYLIDRQEIPREKMSMQAIREWLERHPDQMDAVLCHNESFVFFRLETGGPYGSLNVALTPLRSIATDPRVFPRAGLCFASLALPDPSCLEPLPDQWKQAGLFVLNQDTGGAIKGAARADLFCGNSHYAEFTAGHMNVRGALYFLVLKP